jgi:transcriptional regulator with XRE-family HTH domain
MSDPLKQRIGARVQAARRRAGISQETLATAVDRTPESISNIERGLQLPTIPTLAELARVLDVPLAAFFEGVGHEKTLSRQRMRMEAELQEVLTKLSDRAVAIALEQIKALSEVRGE